MDIWHLQLEGHAPTRRDDWAVLDPQEKARCLRLRSPILRRRYVAAHAGLRRILAQQLGCAPQALIIGHEPGGRPVLRAIASQTASCGYRAGRGDRPSDFPLLHFSLSHAGDEALVALSPRHPVGVDLETLPASNDLPADLAPHLVASERATLDRLRPEDRPNEALRLWVCKEAWLKASGQGLALEPAAVGVRAGPGGYQVERLPSGACPRDWRLDVHEAPGRWMGALAWPGAPTARPRWLRWQSPR